MDDESQDPGGKRRLGRQHEAKPEPESEAVRRRAEIKAAVVDRKLDDAARANAIRALGSIDPAALEAVLASKEAYALSGSFTPEIRAALDRGLELWRLERLACGIDVEGSGEEAAVARDAAVERLMGLASVFER